MKKLLAALLCLMLLCGAAQSEEIAGGRIEMNGVTFVIEDVRLDVDGLVILVMQTPDDERTSLLDNQTEYSPDDPDFVRDVDSASQYGERLLGTLCDILALTDEKGDSLLNEYAVSTRRIGASLRDEFRVYLPADNTARELRVELVFGVNDNLSSRFNAPASYLLTIPMYAD